MGAYVYYSYEQHGRGYIGARNRNAVDDAYFGTFSDDTFNPTEKVVIAEFETFEEALAAEVELHNFFEVDVNPHFANRARQTSSGFQFNPTGRVHAEETKAKISATQKGKPRGGNTHSADANRRRSEALKGRPKSKEHRAKIAKGVSGERNARHRNFKKK